MNYLTERSNKIFYQFSSSQKERYESTNFKPENILKGLDGESAVTESLNHLNIPNWDNITYKKNGRISDIDHLALTHNSLWFVETKNWAEHIIWTPRLFADKVLDRYISAKPIVEWYCRCFRRWHPNLKVRLILITSFYNIQSPIVQNIVQSLNLQIIVTGRQILFPERRDLVAWYRAIRDCFFHVYNIDIKNIRNTGNIIENNKNNRRFSPILERIPQDTEPPPIFSTLISPKDPPNIVSLSSEYLPSFCPFKPTGKMSS